eukprot:1195262-Prorocentrum_minimum.AAC.2
MDPEEVREAALRQEWERAKERLTLKHRNNSRRGSEGGQALLDDCLFAATGDDDRDHANGYREGALSKTKRVFSRRVPLAAAPDPTTEVAYVRYLAGARVTAGARSSRL